MTEGVEPCMGDHAHVVHQWREVPSAPVLVGTWDSMCFSVGEDHGCVPAHCSRVCVVGNCTYASLLCSEGAGSCSYAHAVQWGMSPLQKWRRGAPANG